MHRRDLKLAYIQIKIVQSGDWTVEFGYTLFQGLDEENVANLENFTLITLCGALLTMPSPIFCIISSDFRFSTQ